VISPLLSNLYMRRFLLGWKQLGHEKRLRAKIVNYADDFVICCRGTAAKAMHEMQGMMARLKLTVNTEKTRLCRLPLETFDFLGYTFGRLWSSRTGNAYLGLRPSQKALQRLRTKVHEETSRTWLWQSPEAMARKINRLLVGWANYFRVGTIWRAWGSVDYYIFQRLRQWWCRKYGIRNRRDARFSTHYLHHEMAVIRLRDRRPRFS
jgi:RNA-directed DNA polymerase